jgi:cytoskeleton protein RodZ
LPDIEKNMSDPSAPSPGAILKRCREYHNLSLEEAEESTKIGANYLLALEEDQVSQFSSLAYLKGFLRIYATYLGLNPDDMIRLYEKLYSASSEGGGQNTGTAGVGDPPPRKKFPLQKLAIPAVILVLILITASIINRSPSPPVRPIQPASTTLPIAATPIQQTHSTVRQAGPAKIPDESIIVQKQKDSPPPALNGAQKPSSESTRGFVVRLKVTQGGALTVTIDGSASQDYDLVAGDSIEWKADRTITLELSNAGGVETELNGRPLKPFGQSGKPATVVLDPEGIRQ